LFDYENVIFLSIEQSITGLYQDVTVPIYLIIIFSARNSTTVPTVKQLLVIDSKDTRSMASAVLDAVSTSR